MAITLKMTQRKLDGPSLEERWLEEVSSKDRYFSGTARKSGWRAGGKCYSNRRHDKARAVSQEIVPSRSFHRAVLQCSFIAEACVH